MRNEPKVTEITQVRKVGQMRHCVWLQAGRRHAGLQTLLATLPNPLSVLVHHLAFLEHSGILWSLLQWNFPRAPTRSVWQGSQCAFYRRGKTGFQVPYNFSAGVPLPLGNGPNRNVSSSQVRQEKTFFFF